MKWNSLFKQTILLWIFLKAVFQYVVHSWTFFKIYKSFTKCKASTQRSSHRRCSMKKGVLKNFAKFTGKHLCQILFFNKVAGLRPQRRLQPWWLFGRWLLCFVFQVEISYSYITSHTLFADFFKHPRRMWLCKFRFRE